MGAGGITGVTLPGFGRNRCVFVAVDKTGPGQGRQAIEQVWERGPADLVIAVDGDTDLADWEQVLFRMCANADPGRDLVRSEHRLGIDATRKLPGDEHNGQPVRDFPPVMEMSEPVRQRVAERWGEYGLG